MVSSHSRQNNSQGFPSLSIYKDPSRHIQPEGVIALFTSGVKGPFGLSETRIEVPRFTPALLKDTEYPELHTANNNVLHIHTHPVPKNPVAPRNQF